MSFVPMASAYNPPIPEIASFHRREANQEVQKP